MAERNFDAVGLVLHPRDNVAVLKQALKPGDEFGKDGVRIQVTQNVPPGHKLALIEIPEGKPVRKYGQVIGIANARIAPGEHVHTHNLEPDTRARDYQFCIEHSKLTPAPDRRYFSGYARPDGRVGTRNYIAVISSVNCSASVCRQIRDHFRTDEIRREFPEVDGVIALTHAAGCGCDAGASLRLLQRVLAGMARHPNIAGCVLVGLGCEVNHLHGLCQAHSLDRCGPGEPSPAFLNIQTSGGVRKTVAEGIAAVSKLLPVANGFRRALQPISKLILAENCGGSDANSGITANPALGVASDQLIRHGGTSVLAETPEIYGAEHLLVRRAVSHEVGERLLELVRWWEEHAREHHSTLESNPSPGNKAGGLTNITEKSLGAIAKGGRAPLTAVYRYAEPIQTQGLCFMDTPGFDPVSMTGLVAGGCNIAVFTTGRGSVYGCKPAPCIKVATNTLLFEHMEDDIDINAGTILTSAETVEQVGSRIFDKLIAVASGERTKSELAGIGEEEFVPWQLGPTL